MNRLSFFIFLFLASQLFVLPAKAQQPDTAYFNNEDLQVPGFNYMDYYRVSNKRPDGKYDVKKYYPNNRLMSSGVYTASDSGVRDGYFVHYNKKGIKDFEGNYANGKAMGAHKSYYDTSGKLWIVEEYKYGLLDGDMLVYYEDGLVRRKEFFRNDKSVSGKCYGRDGKGIAYFPMEMPPLIDSGKVDFLTYLVKNVHYPDEAREAGIAGVVKMKIKINEQGIVEELRCISTPHQSMADEMARVITSIKKITPATYDGQPIKMSMVIPFTFRLE